MKNGHIISIYQQRISVKLILMFLNMKTKMDLCCYICKL
jgi:hypothetical protein